jgi:hypothetical protein
MDDTVSTRRFAEIAGRFDPRVAVQTANHQSWWYTATFIPLLNAPPPILLVALHVGSTSTAHIQQSIRGIG